MQITFMRDMILRKIILFVIFVLSLSPIIIEGKLLPTDLPTIKDTHIPFSVGYDGVSGLYTYQYTILDPA